MKWDGRKIAATVTAFSIITVPQLLAQAEQATKQLTPGEELGKESLFTLIIKGGWVMIPIGLCSIVALTLFFERIISMGRAHIVPKGFTEELHKSLAGGTNVDAATEYCASTKSVVGKIIGAALLKWKQTNSLMEIEKAIEDTAYREVGRLRRALRGLKIIAGIAPMLGLLGTVYGMIRAFQTVAASSAAIGKAAKLASGIYEAMVTTAAGLTIAIPVLLAYYFLLRWVDDYADEIQHISGDFIDVAVKHTKTDK